MTKAEQIRANLQRIRDRIDGVCREHGRSPAAVTVVAVTKSVDVATARIAYETGLRELGENRPQELVVKADAFLDAGIDCRFHQIGTLQRNKVKFVLGRASLIHSVESIGLAERIERLSAERGLVSDVLLQVNISGEASKRGYAPAELEADLPALVKLAHLRLRGLMTMAPITAGEAEARLVFAETRRLLEQMRARFGLADFTELSMGMSQDYPAAVAEGATIVRIGSALFSGVAGLEDGDGACSNGWQSL